MDPNDTVMTPCHHSARAKIVGRHKACIMCHCLHLQRLAIKTKNKDCRRESARNDDIREIVQQYRVIESVISAHSNSCWFEYESNIRAITTTTLELLKLNETDLLDSHLSQVISQVCKKSGSELKEVLMKNLIAICGQEFNLSSFRFLRDVLRDEQCCRIMKKTGQDIVVQCVDLTTEGTPEDSVKVVMYGILSLIYKAQDGFSLFFIHLEKLFRDVFRVLHTSTYEPLCLELLAFLENVFSYDRAISLALRMEPVIDLSNALKKTLLMGLVSVQLPLMRILNHLMSTFKQSRQQSLMELSYSSVGVGALSTTSTDILDCIPSIFMRVDLPYFVSQMMDTTNIPLFDAMVLFLEQLCPEALNTSSLPVVLESCLRVCIICMSYSRSDLESIVYRLVTFCLFTIKTVKILSQETQQQIIRLYEALPESSNLSQRVVCSKMFEFCTDPLLIPRIEKKVDEWMQICQEEVVESQSLTSKFLRILLSLLYPLVASRDKDDGGAASNFYLQVLLRDGFVCALRNFVEYSDSQDEEISPVKVLMTLLASLPVEKFFKARKYCNGVEGTPDTVSVPAEPSSSLLAPVDSTNEEAGVIWHVYLMIRNDFRFVKHVTISELWNKCVSELFGGIVWDHFDSFGRIRGSGDSEKKFFMGKWCKTFEELPLSIDDWGFKCGEPLQVNGELISSFHQEILLCYYFFDLFAPDDFKFFRIGNDAFQIGFYTFLENLAAIRSQIHLDELIFYSKIAFRIASSSGMSPVAQNNISEIFCTISSKSEENFDWKEIFTFSTPTFNCMLGILNIGQMRTQLEAWVGACPKEFEEFLIQTDTANTQGIRIALMDLIVNSTPEISSQVIDILCKNDSKILQLLGISYAQVFDSLSSFINKLLDEIEIPLTPAPSFNAQYHSNKFYPSMDYSSTSTNKNKNLRPKTKIFTFLIQLYLKIQSQGARQVIELTSKFLYGFMKILCVARNEPSFVNVGLEFLYRMQVQSVGKYYLTERFIRDTDFMALLEQLLSFNSKDWNSKLRVCKILTVMSQDKSYYVDWPQSSPIRFRLRSLLPVMQYALIDSSHLVFLMSLLQADLQSSLVSVEELSTDDKQLKATLADFQFYILGLIQKACTSDCEATLWRTLLELFGFAQRHDAKKSSSVLVDSFLLDPWLQYTLKLLLSCRVTDPALFGILSCDFLNFLKQWSYFLAQRSTRNKRFYQAISFAQDGRSSDTAHFCRDLQKLLSDSRNFAETDLKLATIVFENAGLVADFLDEAL